jgi:hypothetical protein
MKRAGNVGILVLVLHFAMSDRQGIRGDRGIRTSCCGTPFVSS